MSDLVSQANVGCDMRMARVTGRRRASGSVLEPIVRRHLHLRAAFAAAALLGASASVAAEPASAPPDPFATAEGERVYLLAFRDEPIGEVADAVLGGALGRAFEVDPAVRGTMSFRADEPMTEAALLARFRQALAAEGVAVTARGEALVLSLAPPPAPAATTSPPAAAPPMIRAPEPAAVAPRESADPPIWPWAAGGLAALGLAGLLLTQRGGRPREPRPQPASPHDAVLSRLLTMEPRAVAALPRARVEAERVGVPTERALAMTGGVSEEALAQAYAEVSGCARWRPAAEPPLSADAVPPALASRMRRARLVPLALGDRLVAATDDPLDTGQALALAEEGRPLVLRVGTLGEIARVLDEAPVAANDLVDAA